MKHLSLRLSSLVVQRGWYVHHLKEFYPKSRNLLGTNAGKGNEINLRFRVHGQKSQFIAFHEVLCTALHEIAHCQVSRHDKKFWKLYYELVSACEEQEMQQCVSGASSPWPSLPLFPSASPSDTASQRSSRSRGSSSFTGGGQRLGGSEPPPQTRKGLLSLLARKVSERYTSTNTREGRLSIEEACCTHRVKRQREVEGPRRSSSADTAEELPQPSPVSRPLADVIVISDDDDG